MFFYDILPYIKSISMHSKEPFIIFINYVLTAIEKMNLATLKEVRCKSFFSPNPNDYFTDE